MGGEFLLEQGHRRILRRCIAEEVTRLQHPVDFGAGGFGDGFGVEGIGRKGHLLRLS